MKRRDFHVFIERDEDGWLVATVPNLRGCHTQAKTMDKLLSRIKEAIELCLEVEKDEQDKSEFVGIQRVTVGA
jgi:predicted RNase H-like HicB family nuclease